MKKLLALLMTFAILLSFAGCGAAEEAPAVTTQPKRDYSEFAGIVADPKTWYEEFMALPIANENMTEDELRQLAADAFRVNLTFPWTPTQDIAFQYTLLNNSYEGVLPAGIAYSGLAYNNNAARGTVWKVLNYYDPETGAVDIEAMCSSALMNLTSACSLGAMQGWNRVSNSHGLTDMSSYNKGLSNIVPVGDYDYQPFEHSFAANDGTPRIIEKNGEAVMCESYALMKTADGLYSSDVYHVMMCAADAVVVRHANGTIDKNNSYVLVYEQRMTGTRSDELNYTQENGITMRPLGTVDHQYSFQMLLDQGYVPFTFKEFIGEDPVEPGKAWVGTKDIGLENGTDITIKELSGKVLGGNYAPCTVEIQVQDASGVVLYAYKPDLPTTPAEYSISLSSSFDAEALQPYANGTNTIHIYARLSNGELLEAFATTLRV